MNDGENTSHLTKTFEGIHIYDDIPDYNYATFDHQPSSYHFNHPQNVQDTQTYCMFMKVEEKQVDSGANKSVTDDDTILDDYK